MNETKLTQDEVTKVYNTLAPIDSASTDALNNAELETERSDYRELSEIDFDNNMVGVAPADPRETQFTESSINEVLGTYGITSEDAIRIIELIEEYRNGDESNLYSRAPKSLQTMCDNIVASESIGLSNNQIKAIKNNAAKMMLDSFINDAGMDTAMHDFNKEIGDTLGSMGTEFDSLVKEAIDNTFNSIDKIREENPEKAKNIELVKAAFEEAEKFNNELEYASRIPLKRLTKMLNRYRDEVFYFNKKIADNTFGIKIRDINRLLPVLKIGCEATDDELKMFIIILIRSMGDINTLHGIATIYKKVQNISMYNYSDIDQKGLDIFSNISKVIETIRSKEV